MPPLCASLLAVLAPLADGDPDLEAALTRAGSNRTELEAALGRVSERERAGLEFLLRYMPEGDLTSLPADFLVEHVRYAYRAWDESPWRDAVPEERFLENVLPYASINERRDPWRKEFFERFRPLVAEAETPSQATAILNNAIFPMVGVRDSTQRPKADQSPRFPWPGDQEAPADGFRPLLGGFAGVRVACGGGRVRWRPRGSTVRDTYPPRPSSHPASSSHGLAQQSQRGPRTGAAPPVTPTESVQSGLSSER